ncbi:hypothetical protein [Streptomyces vilmorinianum]|uniref:hypothetical protein n=1 Tax=Streptomyces vilmorinianum TaxID=3051092 RepID=UPI0010FBA1CF|nr:hypothetical protein [Streptomyces vilmorinianum]
MATEGRKVSELIESACAVMSQLAMDPLALEIDPGGTRLLAVMRESSLRVRSRGPYTPDDLPPEALDMIEWLSLLWSMEPERPHCTIAGGGRWPALVVTFPVSWVRVHYLVPEEAPWAYPPHPGNEHLGTDIKLALRYLAGSLREAARESGDEPPVTLSLSFPEDPTYEERAAKVDARFRDILPTVVPTIEVDRSRCSPRQRAAHDKALRTGAYSNQGVAPLGRTGFTARIGNACFRDSGG